MRLLSMYSGIGGMDLGAHWAGIETVAFCEQDPFCRSVLSRHWPGVPIFETDEAITAASVREFGGIDIIAGGPPCQPFSVAGKREGTTDPRHRWPEMARVVAELRPAFVVVENVAGFGDVAEQLVRPDLERLGYETARIDIPAAGVGAPHKRERIFIVAYSGCESRGAEHEQQHGERADQLGRGGVGLADTNRPVRNESEPVARSGRATVAGGSRVGVGPVADSDYTGRGERRGAESVRSELGSAECRSDGAVAHADEFAGDDAGSGAGEVQRVVGKSAGVRRHSGVAQGDSDCEQPEGSGRGDVRDEGSGAGGDGGVADTIGGAWRSGARNADDEARQREPERGGGVGDSEERGWGELRAEAEHDEGGPKPERAGVRMADSSRDGGRIEFEVAGSERERVGIRGEQIGGPRSTESRLGRGFDGVAARLDEARWPAPRGAAQYEWEPPRTTTEREWRRKRLKALGNACVPLQVYPIFAAIVAAFG